MRRLVFSALIMMLMAFDGFAQLLSEGERFSLTDYYRWEFGELMQAGREYKNWGNKVKVEHGLATKCYDANCVKTYFEDLVLQSEDILLLTAQHRDKLFKSTLSQIENEVSKAKEIPFSKLDEIVSPLFTLMMQQDWYQGHNQAYFNLQNLLKDCDTCLSQQKLIEENAPQLLTAGQIDLMTSMCVIQTQNVTKAISKKGKDHCRRLLMHTFDLIYLRGQPGTFADEYSDIWANNPKYDEYVKKFYTRLKPELDVMKAGYADGKELHKDDSIKERFKNIDLGKIALEVTGNSAEAMTLLQITIGDPGAFEIYNYTVEKLSKKDPARASKLRSMLNEFDVIGPDYLANMLRVTPQFLGVNFQHNWSVRNYKVIAGLSLGHKLTEKGYKPNEIKWISQLIGEAYKVETHGLLQNQRVQGDKPYFVLDSTAHYVGADLGIALANGVKLDEWLAKDYQNVRNQGNKRAESHWQYLLAARKALKTKESINDIRDKTINHLKKITQKK